VYLPTSRLRIDSSAHVCVEPEAQADADVGALRVGEAGRGRAAQVAAARVAAARVAPGAHAPGLVRPVGAVPLAVALELAVDAGAVITPERQTGATEMHTNSNIKHIQVRLLSIS